MTKSFGHITALRSIDLQLSKGEFLTIFGPNGAGKTTLLKILATLTKPTAGRVKISGLNVKETPEKLRLQIGFISHNTFLYDNLTAYENLKFYGWMYGISGLTEKIRESLGEVGLLGRIQDKAGTFSRGMQQRLSIARAMLHNPSIILLDEPYSGLDQHAAQILRNLLRKLHNGNRTLIMTTHNINQGLELCDRVVVLVEGRVVFQARIQEIDKGNFEQIYFQLVEEAT